MLNISNEAKKFCLEKMKTYEGKLGSDFLIALTLSIEKKIKIFCNKKSLYNLDALLIANYFHDLGRIIDDGKNHPVESFKLFKEWEYSKYINKKSLNIIEDCCLNHGSKSKPFTKEGKLLQIFDKTVVFEPEIILLVLKDFYKIEKNFDIAYMKFVKKMEKWHSKIPDENTKKVYEKTLKLIREVCNNEI